MLPRWSEQMLYYKDIKVRSKRSGEATSKYTSQALSEPLTRWRAPAPSQPLHLNLPLYLNLLPHHPYNGSLIIST